MLTALQVANTGSRTDRQQALVLETICRDADGIDVERILEESDQKTLGGVGDWTGAIKLIVKLKDFSKRAAQAIFSAYNGKKLKIRLGKGDRLIEMEAENLSFDELQITLQMLMESLET